MLITGTDFNDGAVNYSTCHFVEKERYEQDKHIQIKNGSILITKDGTLGKVAYVQGLSMPATLNAGVFNVEIKDETKVDNKYLFQYLKAPFLMDYVDKKATGGTIKHLNQNILVDFPVVMPSKAEQEAIGVYFQQLDNLITLHQRNSADFVSRFLSDFTNTWEQRKLGELCNITTGKLDANAMVSDGQYDFYTSGIDVFKIDVAAFEGPAITIAGNGASVGYMHLADGKFNAYQRTYVLTDFLADRQFLNVAIGNELPNKIQEEVRGSGIPYIVLNMLTDLAIPFPSHEEQYAIGVYFQQLDNLITLHQRECFFVNLSLITNALPNQHLYSQVLE